MPNLTIPRVVASTYSESSPFDPDHLEHTIAQTECKFDIRKGTEKNIVWANDKREKTPLSVLYLHGWSASRQEIHPIPELVAKHLKANLYNTRLPGHGHCVTDEDARLLAHNHPMVVHATADNLLEETTHALEIALQLGTRVVIVGFSAGGALATWAASQPRYKDKIAALLLISPAFAITNPLFSVLQWIDCVLRRFPYGERLRRGFVEFVQGDVHHFPVCNELHERYWTHTYPIVALLNLADIIWLVGSLHFKDVIAPVFVAASPKDDTACFKESQRRFAEFSCKHKSFLQIDDNDHLHVIVGDILSPKLTKRVADACNSFLDTLKRE